MPGPILGLGAGVGEDTAVSNTDKTHILSVEINNK